MYQLETIFSPDKLVELLHTSFHALFTFDVLISYLSVLFVVSIQQLCYRKAQMNSVPQIPINIA